MENTNKSFTFAELKEKKYGEEGSKGRIDFEAHSQAFRVGKKIRKFRKEKNLTQEQLAEKIGTQKSYISRVENGADINLSTLFKIFNHGLGVPLMLIAGEVV